MRVLLSTVEYEGHAGAACRVYFYEDCTVHCAETVVNADSAAWLREFVFGPGSGAAIVPAHGDMIFHYLHLEGEIFTEVRAFAVPEFGAGDGYPFGENPYEEDPFGDPAVAAPEPGGSVPV